MAVSRVGIFGEGITHGRPVWSNHIRAIPVFHRQDGQFTIGECLVPELLCQFADSAAMPDGEGMHADKRFVIRIECRPFSRHPIDRIWPIEHNDCGAASFARAHAKVERPNKSVVTRPDVLKIHNQHIEPVQHFRSRLAMFTVKTVNRNVQTRMLVAFPFHHVVLCLAEKSVLRAKEGGEAKQIAIVSLQDPRCVFKSVDETEAG